MLNYLQQQKVYKSWNFMQKSARINQAAPDGKKSTRCVSEFGTSITSGRSAHTQTHRPLQ